MEADSRLVDEQDLVSLIAVHGRGLEFQEEGQEPANTPAPLLGIKPFLLILDPEFNEGLSTFLGIGVIVVAELEIYSNLIVLPHILSPEVLEIQGEFPVEVLNFLFQDPAGRLLKEGVFKSGNG